jgi:hypothetical protein
MIFRAKNKKQWAAVKSYIDKVENNEKAYTVEVKLQREKRSIDQNRLYWLWLTCIMHETGQDKNDLHAVFAAKFLGTDKTTVKLNGVEYSTENVRTTTNLDTKQFKYYLDRVQQFANVELGIELPNPEDQYFEQFETFYKNYI